jgi:hypothetical protein
MPVDLKLAAALMTASVVTLMLAADAAQAQSRSPAHIMIDRLPAPAEQPVVRVTTRLRNCTASPTVSIVAQWTRTRRSSRPRIQISGLESVVQTFPPAERPAPDVLRFSRAHRLLTRERVQATVAADWIMERNGQSCTLALPELAVGGSQGVELRGVTRVASGVVITKVSRPAERTTLREYVWTCVGEQGDGCQVDVTLDASSSSDRPPGDEQDDRSATGTLPLLLLAGVVLAGLAAASRNSSQQPGGNMTWEDLAKQALSDAKEPITAKATNIAKFGAPAAAVVSSVVVVLLGDTWQLDTSRSEVVIAAAVVAAAVMLGVYHAFASDVRTRGAVAVARLERLSALAGEEMRRDATRAEDADAVKAASVERDAAAKEAADARTALEVANAELDECREARTLIEMMQTESQQAEERSRLEARIAELQRQLEEWREVKPTPQTAASESAWRSAVAAALVTELLKPISDPITAKIRAAVAEQLGSTSTHPAREGTNGPDDVPPAPDPQTQADQEPEPDQHH